MLTVAAGAVYLLRQNVLAGFGDYAVGIELDRLDELSTALAARYRSQGNWNFLPKGDAKRDWIAQELLRLQDERERRALAVPAPAAPAAPAADAVDAAPAAELDAPASPFHVPPALPAPPAPPAPPALPFPALPAAAPGDDGVAYDLHQRVTLLDADGRYLAGRRPGALPLAQRPIEAGGRTVGYLGVARSHQPSDAMALAFLEQLRSSLWQIVVAAVALSALAGALLARHFRRPIGQLADGAAALAGGRYDVRLPDTRSDELGSLARHFNALAAQLDSMEAARRQWVADTSHELRTPLAVLRAQLEALQDGVRSATPDTLDAMLRQVLALNKLIDELYALARADVGALDCKPVPLDLWRLATEAARGFEERLRGAGLALDLDQPPPSAPVLCDPDRLRQVLDNLFENSLRYTAAGGRIAVHAHTANRRMCLVIDDSAPGVPDEAIARLGERFYRVDASRSRAHGGAGLGLALCRRILEAQGGDLQFAHAPLGGLRVTVSLPLAREAE